MLVRVPLMKVKSELIYTYIIDDKHMGLGYAWEAPSLQVGTPTIPIYIRNVMYHHYTQIYINYTAFLTSFLQDNK